MHETPDESVSEDGLVLPASAGSIAACALAALAVCSTTLVNLSWSAFLIGPALFVFGLVSGGLGVSGLTSGHKRSGVAYLAAALGFCLSAWVGLASATGS